MALTPDELKQFEIAIGMDILEVQMRQRLLTESQKAILTLRQVIFDRQLAGQTNEAIVEALILDIETGGPIFAPITSGFKSQAGKIIVDTDTSVQQTMFKDIYGKAGREQMVWIAKLINTCPDCIDLHGRVETRAYWEQTGLPNSRGTICETRGSCHCDLLPMTLDNFEKASTLTKPIQLQKKKIIQYRKKVGHKLSRSYRRQLLGQANNVKSIVK